MILLPAPLAAFDSFLLPSWPCRYSAPDSLGLLGAAVVLARLLDVRWLLAMCLWASLIGMLMAEVVL